MTVLRVTFASWPSDAEHAWTSALREMGVQAQFEPDFDPKHPDGNSCWVALDFPTDSTLPVAKKLRGFGPFASGFGYEATASGAVFSISTEAERLPALVCACALAAATGGELVMGELRAYGTSGAELLGKLVPSGTVLQGEPKPTRFKGWQV